VDEIAGIAPMPLVAGTGGDGGAKIGEHGQMMKLAMATLLLVAVLSPAHATDCGDALQDISKVKRSGGLPGRRP
jgi:hypothetical protein